MMMRSSGINCAHANAGVATQPNRRGTGLVHVGRNAPVVVIDGSVLPLAPTRTWTGSVLMVRYARDCGSKNENLIDGIVSVPSFSGISTYVNVFCPVTTSRSTSVSDSSVGAKTSAPGI